MAQINVEITDEEVKDFDKQFEKALTFDLVAPLTIDGGISNYFTHLDITMSNGDEVEFEYSENPTRHWFSINGVTFQAGEMDDDPAYFIRSMYKKHLEEKIKREK